MAQADLELDLKTGVTRINCEAAVSRIVNDFQFEKVEKVMEVLGWKWHDRKEGYHPTVNDLKITATQLLTEAYTLGREKGYQTTMIGTGGLYATYHVAKWLDNREELILTFELDRERS